MSKTDEKLDGIRLRLIGLAKLSGGDQELSDRGVEPFEQAAGLALIFLDIATLLEKAMGEGIDEEYQEHAQAPEGGSHE